jgi:hypothetical protein
MDLLNAGKPLESPLGLGSAGLGMWSFETDKLAEVERRVSQTRTKIVTPTKTITVPGIGRVKSLVVSTPDGFNVEVYQRVQAP